MKLKKTPSTLKVFDKVTSAILIFGFTLQSCNMRTEIVSGMKKGADEPISFNEEVSDTGFPGSGRSAVYLDRSANNSAVQNRVTRQTAVSLSSNTGSCSSWSKFFAGLGIGLVAGGGVAFGAIYMHYSGIVSEYDAKLLYERSLLDSCDFELNGRVIKNSSRLLQKGNGSYYRPGCKDQLRGYVDPLTNLEVFGYKSLAEGNSTVITNATTISPNHQNPNMVITKEGALERLYGIKGCENPSNPIINESACTKSYTGCMNALYGTGPSDPGYKNLLRTNTSGYPWGTAPTGCLNSLNTSQALYSTCTVQLSTSQASNTNLTGLYNSCNSQFSALNASHNNCTTNLATSSSLYNSCNSQLGALNASYTTCNASLNTLNTALLACQKTQPNVNCTTEFGTNCNACISNTTCTNCSSGLYPKIGNPGCATCASLFSNCANCNSNLVGTTSCISCNSGYYSNGVTCNICSTGCTACNSLTACTSCSTSLFLSNGSCVNCGTAVSNCASCTKTSSGGASCSACSSNYTLQSGGTCALASSSNSTSTTSCRGVYGWPNYIAMGAVTDNTPGKGKLSGRRVDSLFKYADLDGAGDVGKITLRIPTNQTIPIAFTLAQEFSKPVIPVMIGYTIEHSLGLDYRGFGYNKNGSSYISADEPAKSFAKLMLDMQILAKGNLNASYIINPDFLGMMQQQSLYTTSGTPGFLNNLTIQTNEALKKAVCFVTTTFPSLNYTTDKGNSTSTTYTSTPGTPYQVMQEMVRNAWGLWGMKDSWEYAANSVWYPNCSASAHTNNVVVPTFTNDLKGWIQATNWAMHYFGNNGSITYAWQENLWSVDSSNWVHKELTEAQIDDQVSSKVASFLTSLGVYSGSYAPHYLAFDRYEFDDTVPVALNAGYLYNSPAWDNVLIYVRQVKNRLGISNTMLWQIPGGHIQTQTEVAANTAYGNRSSTAPAYFFGQPSITANMSNAADYLKAITLNSSTYSCVGSNCTFINYMTTNGYNWTQSNGKLAAANDAGVFAILWGGGQTQSVGTFPYDDGGILSNMINNYYSNPQYLTSSTNCSNTTSSPDCTGIANCSTCNSLTICTTCNIGYNLSNGSCVANCTNMNNCSTCSSPTICTTCNIGYNLSNGSCVANCTNMNNCSTCSSPTICTTCNTGYNLSNGSCVANCTGIANCSTCSSPTTCTLCNTGYNLRGGSCEAPYSSKIGEYYCIANCNNASSIASIHPNVTSVTFELVQVYNGADYGLSIPNALGSTSSQIKALGKKVGVSITGDLTMVLSSPNKFVSNVTSIVTASGLDKIDIELTLGNGTATDVCSMLNKLRTSLPNATEIEVTIDPTGAAKVGSAIPAASNSSSLSSWNKAISIINCGLPYISRVNLRLYTPYSGANMTQMVLDLNNWNNASFSASSFSGVPASKMGLIFLAHNSTEAARVWSASSYNYTDPTSLTNFMNTLNLTYGIIPSSLLVQGATFDAINNKSISNVLAKILGF